MKVTIEQEGKETVVFEGEICIISVGTHNKLNDVIKDTHTALVGAYPLLCRLIVGICAQMSQGFIEWVEEREKNSKPAKVGGKGK